MRGNGFCTVSSLLVSRSMIVSSRFAAVQYACHHRHDQVLGEVHHVVQARVRHFGLDHPELGEVTTRLGLLGAERRPEGVDAAQRHRRGLEVQLAALRQVRLLVIEVLDREERRRAFARGRREDWRIGEDEAARVEEVADGVDHFVADAEDGLLPFAADPQVTAIEQEVDAVFLRRDGEVVRLADDLQLTSRRSRNRSERACRREPSR